MATTSTDDSLWIRRFHPASGASRPRLLCLPHAGGSASFYLPLSAALAAEMEVLAVQYPGRQDRRQEPFVPTLEALADQVYAVLRPLDDGRPLALFGHSMGALLGFELARRLERDGREPAVLIASGRRGPGTYRAENVHHRDDEGLVRELKSLSGTESALLDDDELLRMVLPAIRNDYRAVETYARKPGKALSCPLVVLIGEDDPRVTVAEAEAWEEETTGPFALHTYPGGHFYLTAHQTAVIGRISTYVRKFAGQ